MTHEFYALALQNVCLLEQICKKKDDRIAELEAENAALRAAMKSMGKTETVCDCEIPKPIDPYSHDRFTCRDCNGQIPQ